MASAPNDDLYLQFRYCQHDTMSSFSTRWFTTTSTTAPALVLPNGQSVAIIKGGGYEIYSGTGGVVMVRKLTQ